MKMRLFLILTMALLADSKKDYLTIEKIVQRYTDGSQMEAQKFIVSEKRIDPALCDACPEVALPANATCDTRWAPQYGQLNAEEDCECLISYQCCPGKCQKTAENACADNATDNSNVTSRAGSFFTQQGNDCCDCPTAVCVPCPPPVTAGALACGACYHYNAHHSQHNKTMCWESGCKRNKPISYPDPGCDTRCQMNITKKDDCDNDKAICINKPTPFGCKPAKPKEKPCFLQPKKVYQEKFYFSGGTCQKCWVWEVKRKPEGCKQIFPLSESCPAGHKKTSGVTTCNVAREICLPCEETIPNCNECEEMGTVKDQCGNSVETCVKKSCPSLSQWTGKKCGGTLKIGKDRCGCESIKCDRQCPPQSGNSEFTGGMKEWKTSRYLAGKVTTTWTAARQQCQKAGGDLVSFESREELMFVFPEAHKTVNGQAWTSAQRIGSTRNSQWATGGMISSSDPAWLGSYPTSDANRKCMGFCSQNGCSVPNTYFDAPCNGENGKTFCEFKNCY